MIPKYTASLETNYKMLQLQLYSKFDLLRIWPSDQRLWLGSSWGNLAADLQIVVNICIEVLILSGI